MEIFSERTFNIAIGQTPFTLVTLKSKIKSLLYRSELESRYFCSDLIFQNFGWAHTGSCVLDLLQFLFTSIDPEVRRDFLADFVCSVYYDNFVKTVIALNDKLSIFR